MTWVRLDDGFATNPKIVALTNRELRIWIRVLCYCGKLQDPTVDRITKSEVPGLSLAVIRRLVELELLDVSGDDYEVHDWDKYQPKDLTGASRQAKWRARKALQRNAESNADVDAPDRYENVTLARVTRRRDTVPVPEPVPEEQNPFLPSSPTKDVEQEGRTEIKQRKPTEAEIVSARELGHPLPGELPDEEPAFEFPSPFREIPA